MDELEREVKKLKNLVQNKNKSQEELEILAKEKIERSEILGALKFTLPGEEKFAKELLEKYLSAKSFEIFAERDTLRTLIDFEIILERVKSYINTETSKANPVPPVQMLDQLQKFSEHIEDLKDKLHLTEKEEQKTVLDEWNKLKAKALVYYKESAGCNVAKCPECKKLFMILKDMRGHTTEKITFFKKTILYNKEMYSWFDKGTITKEQLALALGVSINDVILVYENIYKNESKEE